MHLDAQDAADALDPAVLLELPPGVTLPPGFSLPGRANRSQTGDTNAATSPEERRLQELLRLQFDRRPSSLLQTLARQWDGSPQPTNDVLRFRQDVIAGRWSAAGEFIAQLPENQRVQVYRHVLEALGRDPQPARPGMPTPDGDLVPGAMPENPPMVMPGMPPGMFPAPVLLPDDVLALADIAPGELNDDLIQRLGYLLIRALSKGNYIAPFLSRLEQGTPRLGGADPARRDLAAQLLIAAGRLTDAGRFLPSLEAAKASSDLKALDLHARYHLEVGRQEQNTNSLQQAWELTQLLLASTNALSTNNPAADRDRVLRRALELLPLIARHQGTNWLRASFRDRPGEGMAILAAALGAPAPNLRDAEVRRRNLEQQCQAVLVLLDTVGPETKRWTTPLQVIALNWMQEADLTRERWYQQPRQYPDPYGNYDPMEEMRMQRFNDPNQPQPIAPTALLGLLPNEPWLDLIEDTLRPRVWFLAASLRLKTDEEAKAIPYLEKLASAYPKPALELANDLLRAWTRSHDPNTQQAMMRTRYARYGPVWYGPGSPYGMGGQGVSLTRSMQNRNLRELADLLDRLRRLPLPNLEDAAVVGAFTAAHSQAEVFRAEDIAAVFGPVAQMRLETLAELLQTMRQRLASDWRQMRAQQDAKTRRTDKDIEGEIMRGYEVMTDLIGQGLARWPDHWRLRLVQAATSFDWAEFQYGKKVDLAIYVQKRDEAFAAFEQAAGLYAAQLASLEPKDQTVLAYMQWFNANLGASDLAYVTRQQEASTNQLARLRAALLALPGEAAERHLALFGRELNQSLDTIKPELKPRYVRAGLEIVGDHPSAAEVRKLATHYRDLLGELALEVRVDGDATVGHTHPFGVFVCLRHTVEVEREGGGFGRYLQGQNNPYAYNPYGQQRNVREEFEKQVREKLNEGFDIKVITFADDKVQSRGYGRPGWRETPLAYLLLRAKDGAVDRLPSLHLDLDFFDRRGQVVLPIESPVVLLDARPPTAPVRPVTKLAVTQVLDDRELAAGRLTLDLKATGRGLVPDLKDLLDLNLAGFRLAKTNDSGVTVTKLDTEADDLAGLSERTWLLELVPAEGRRGHPPAVFHFPAARSQEVALAYKRYADADLVEVKPEVALAGIRLKPDWTWLWLTLALLGAATGGFIVWRRRQARATVEPRQPRYLVPSPATPFNVLNLLRQMHRDEHLPLSADRRAELTRAIGELEQGYFAPPTNGKPDRDLAAFARAWVESVPKSK
jgi:hypothetical protein